MPFRCFEWLLLVLSLVGKAESLRERAAEALTKRSDTVTAFRDFSGALDESPKSWTEMVKAWEADNSKPNPFASPKTRKCFLIMLVDLTENLGLDLTANAVRLKLAEEEEKAAKDGTLWSPHSEVTPSVFILQGIELEDAQCVLCIFRPNISLTTYVLPFVSR